MSVSVKEADFDAGAEIGALSAGRDDVGAVASFVGLVRADKADGETSAAAAVKAMTLEHYQGMTEKALEEIVVQAQARWELLGVRVIHRVGRLLPGDRIVFVAVASAHRHDAFAAVASSHRGDAFAACEFIMDYLKTRAPFWKKEETLQGGRWVDARESDDAAAGRWSDSK